MPLEIRSLNKFLGLIGTNKLQFIILGFILITNFHIAAPLSPSISALGTASPTPTPGIAVDSVSFTLYSQFGLCKGQVVLRLPPNSLSSPIICLSALSLGAVITTTNPLNTPSEIPKQIRGSNLFLAFTTPELLTKISNSPPNLPIVLIGTTPNSSPESKTVATLDDATISLQLLRKIDPLFGFVLVDLLFLKQDHAMSEFLWLPASGFMAF